MSGMTLAALEERRRADILDAAARGLQATRYRT
jgi:hypothetical protein